MFILTRPVLFMLFTCLFVLSVTDAKAMSYDEADAVTQRLAKAANLERVKLYIAVDPEWNAFAGYSDNSVVLTTRMLREPDFVVRAVLAHEIAHLAHPFLTDGRNGEGRADQAGMHYMKQAGYDPCEMTKTWKRRFEENGDKGSGNTHPLTSKRWSDTADLCARYTTGDLK